MGVLFVGLPTVGYVGPMLDVGGHSHVRYLWGGFRCLVFVDLFSLDWVVSLFTFPVPFCARLCGFGGLRVIRHLPITDGAPFGVPYVRYFYF